MTALERRGLSRLDLALGLALTGFGLLITLAGPGADTWIATLVVPAVTLPVIWRRRAPLACAAALCAGMVLSGIPSFDQTRCGVAIPAALLILFSLAGRSERRPAAGGLVLVLAGMVFLSFTDSSIDPVALVFLLPLCAGVWAAGRVVRERDRLAAELATRTQQLERRRAETAEVAVDLERTRLAAGIGEMSRRGVQEIIDLTEALEREPERAGRLFSRIETEGREVLNNLRGVLGLLRSDEGPVRSPRVLVAGSDSPEAPDTAWLTPGRAAVAAAVGLAGASLLSEALRAADPPSAVLLVVIAVSYACGAYASRWAAAAAVAALLACLVAIDGSFVPLIFSTVGPTLVGQAVRARRELVSALTERTLELEREAAAFARLAVRRERAKVARDLHDVIAHSLAVVVVQAGAGRMTADGDGQAQRVADIRAAGLQALDGMARLGEVFSSEDRIGTVIDGARAAGLRVNARRLLAGVALSPEIDEISFRILQEGLTNALKHAPGAEVDVSLRVRAGVLEVEVCDRGAREAVTLNGVGAGLGLHGLSERVTGAGGRIEAGARPGGGWLLRARPSSCSTTAPQAATTGSTGSSTPSSWPSVSG
jgi:signal transduction histidine kinase